MIGNYTNNQEFVVRTPRIPLNPPLIRKMFMVRPNCRWGFTPIG